MARPIIPKIEEATKTSIKLKPDFETATDPRKGKRRSFNLANCDLNNELIKGSHFLGSIETV
jgi:hypothetical protein